MNFCYPTRVWVQMMSQCENCYSNNGSITGHWWKYDQLYEANTLWAFTNSSNPLSITLPYIGLASCSWHVNYGCDDDEEH